MSRRFIIILALCALALVAVALFPWRMAADGPTQTLTQQLHRDYGLDVSIRGESTLALLPTPRIKIENVEITGIDNRLSVRNATLRGNIGFFNLLRGQIVLSDLSVSSAETILDLRGADERFWARWAAWMQLRGIGIANPIRQLAINESALTIRREQHPDIVLNQVNTLIGWPESTAPLSLNGNLAWNGKTITIARASLIPSALISGNAGAFVLDMSVPEGQLALSGTLQMERGRNIAINGKSLLRTQSLNALTQWADLPVPLSPLVEAFSIEGAFSTQRNLISWPSVDIALGDDKLEGSLSFRFDSAGYTVTGTLATDDIDLGRYLPPAIPDTEPLSYAPFNRADLDLRLSANTARIGTLKLTDLAIGLIVKPDRLEAALGRASFESGTLKARLLMTGTPINRDVKLQGNVENLNLGRFWTAAGSQPRLTGTARGQVTLEGHGATWGGILRSAHGRASSSIASGDISGIDLSQLLKQAGETSDERRPLPAGGSTAFNSATMGILVENGSGSITNGTIQTGTANATIHGTISLPERSLMVNIIANRESDGDGKPLQIDLHGPWDHPDATMMAKDKPKPVTPVDGEQE